MFDHRKTILSLSLFVGLLLQQAAYGLNPATPKGGDPNGIYRGIFKLSESGSPSTAENDANYHVCATPAYSLANWTEIDATLGGTSGTPSAGPNGRGNPPNYLFTRSNCHYIMATDGGSCTTTNDPWDHNSSSNYFYLGAYVYPDTALTCADLGNQYDIFGRWDSGSADCSYRVWLEAVDSNGGGCVNSDMVYQVRAAFDDAGSTFDCTTYCEVKRTNITIPVSTWTRIDVMFNPVAAPSTAYILINNKQTVTAASAQTCQDGTDIPDGFTIKNSSQDLYIGTEKGTSANCFQGNLSGATVIESPHLNFQRSANLNHLDASAYSSSYSAYSGGEDPLLTYAVRFHAISTPTPGNVITQTDTTNKRYGASMSFDGTDDFAIITPSAAFNDPGRTAIDTLVVDAWIRPIDAVGGRRQTIVSRWLYGDDATCTPSTASSTFNLYLDATGKVNFSVMNTGGTTVNVGGNTVLSNNQWYHVAGVLTGNTTQYLTADRLYVMIDGVSDVTTPATFSGTPNISATANTMLGASPIASPATTCTGVGAFRDFFYGNIDELNINIPTSALGIEAFSNGVVLNEVNFMHNSGLNKGEEIELYAFNDLGHSIDMNGYTLGTCGSSNVYVFDNACGNCASKVVDPGDVVTIEFTPLLVPLGGNIDTSCSGAATSCTWWTENTSAGTPLAAGDIVDAADGLVLYSQSNPTTNAQKFASAVDAVIWGADQGACQDNLSDNVRGLWEATDFLNVGLISDATRSLCLDIDGANEFASASWAQCATTVGSLNATRTTAIQLVSFSAELSDDSGVDVYWGTGIEENVFGYNILRADFEYGDYVQVNPMLIEAKGGSGIGASYSFYDPTGKRTSYYKLQEIEFDGMHALYGPITTKENIAAAKNLESANQTNESGDDGLNSTGSDQDFAAAQSGGCGRIVASDSLAGASLLGIMLLAMFVSTRTYLLAGEKKHG